MELCEKNLKWSRDETRAVIDEVKIKKQIEEVIVGYRKTTFRNSGKISFS